MKKNGFLKFETMDINLDLIKKDAIREDDDNHLRKKSLPMSSCGEESDPDEPLLSGSGEVSKECTETELESWTQVLIKWRANRSQRPNKVSHLVSKGIPEALRPEVWQLLAECHDDEGLTTTYKLLISKESACEMVIKRDINRTFPAHDYFKESGSLGQDSLFRLCKAYSIFDEEIGYCQGLSFMAAALLLHMPEEQAFCVLVKIMHDYGLRNLFRCAFEELHLKFYQLERLMEDQMSDLFNHFMDLGVEAHMYASQWFLTLFTAKFPLIVVFNILDLFLLNGMTTIFQVALALLQISKKELMSLDFEGVLKHFRVQLPKKYRSQDCANLLLATAVRIKVKKIIKYEKEYFVLREQSKQQEDPLQRLQRENKRLVENNMRLEQENDGLAHELVTSKIHLRKKLDIAEDTVDTLGKELFTAKSSLVELEDEKRRLEEEVARLKEMCRRELQKAESEIKRNRTIIIDYKQICSQLSGRLEDEQKCSKEAVDKIMQKIKNCESCIEKFENKSDPLSSNLNEETNNLGELNNKESLETRVRELELELAQTKLALVETECKNQDLVHNLNSAQAELHASKNTWFHKTLSSIRENVGKRDPLGKDKGFDSNLSRENSRDFASN